MSNVMSTIIAYNMCTYTYNYNISSCALHDVDDCHLPRVSTEKPVALKEK